jgi:hypothetical protein
MVIARTGVSWNEEQQALYLLQVAYKMGGVEPYVNAWNWAAIDGRGSPNSHLNMVMNEYPQKAVMAAREAFRIMQSGC